MNLFQLSSRPNLQTAVRTLLLAGFRIENNERQPTHTEIYCSAPMLGSSVPLMIVLTDDDQLPTDIWPQVQLAAQRSNRTLVAIANKPSADQIGWVDFLESFGGAVPSWRALDGSYLRMLELAAQNVQPEGFEGEAWRLFESLGTC